MKNILLRLLLPILAVTYASTSQAQQVLFEDDFSNGIANWTVQAPWHLAAANDMCTAQSNPPALFGAMARVGDSDCTFQSICLWQDPCFRTRKMSTAQGIAIPANATSASLEFDSFVDAEIYPFDSAEVFLTVSGDSTPYLVGRLEANRGSWDSVQLDLSPWIGEEVRIAFELFVYDDEVNNGLGWLVDNVRVSADGLPQNYCIAASNSASNTGAIIGHTGSLSLAQNNSALTLEDGPPGQFSVFFYGPGQTMIPLSQGILCVAGDQNGFRRLLPGALIDAGGAVSFPVDFSALQGAHAISPGMQVNFQCWYRDSAQGQGTSNFSNGLAVTFLP
ncbi:MAG: hypothetical protein P1V35_10520 [Planctomycetota bacterium]|nr:hypothetical protein [Planctomycetota bacterium]